ncbi:MAG TPA: hypothetical protein VLV54_04705 [Thermoanaerobaculia bacterium]|nr:hypothetical protein [Thermoanaerobaculia bacterium]
MAPELPWEVGVEKKVARRSVYPLSERQRVNPAQRPEQENGMPEIIWRNLTSGTVNWEAILGQTPRQGPLGPNQTKRMDSAGVDFVGWAPSGFTGLMVVSIPRTTAEGVEVYATQPGLEGQELLDSLKPGE